MSSHLEPADRWSEALWPRGMQRGNAMQITTSRAGVAVVGIGNLLTRDDGFGVRVVVALERLGPTPGAEKPPGTIFRFTSEALARGRLVIEEATQGRSATERFLPRELMPLRP